MGKWLGDTPEFFQLYSRTADVLTLPFGCYLDLWKLQKEAEWINAMVSMGSILFPNRISLYPYQEKAKLLLISNGGICVMPCGSGKTQTALSAIASLGKPTLWITHTSDLLHQSMKRAKELYDLPADAFGTITSGKIDIGKNITFATVQTLCKIDLEKYRNTWGTIVVDECHHAIGAPTRVMMFYFVLNKLSARYKIGITATPERADGLEKAMCALLGNIVVTIPKSAVQGSTVPVRVVSVRTPYTPTTEEITGPDGTIDYSKAQNILATTKVRQEMVCRNIIMLSDPEMLNKSVLILADRIIHLELMENFCDGFEQSALICGSTPKAQREKAISDLCSGKIKRLFATYQLAREGLDIPTLDCVVFASPRKDAATIVQAAGRCGRRVEGKRQGVVMDFVDGGPLYLKMSAERKRVYKKNDMEIIESKDGYIDLGIFE